MTALTERAQGAVRVAFAGGGTGGHLTPALAVARAVIEMNRHSEVLFVGARGGIEEKAVPAAGFRLELVESTKPPSGLINRGIHAPVILWRLLAARRIVRRVLKEFRCDVVVGTGGYVSAAPLWAAARSRIPAILLEQNAVPGRTNRFIARWAREIHTPFTESVEYLDQPGKVWITGNPVSREIRAVSRKRPSKGGPVLFVTGGSQGALRLNELVADALPELAEKVPGLELLHLSGIEGASKIIDAFAAARIPGEVHDFTTEMESFYARADLVLSRAGGTTIAELTCIGLPSILIPYPHAADDHQRANALALERAGAAVVLDQHVLTPGALAKQIASLFEDRKRLDAMSVAAKRLGWPDAAERVARRIYELAGRPVAEVGAVASAPSAEGKR